MSKSEPWFPSKQLTFGSVFFFIRNSTSNFNAFDTEALKEAKVLILREARQVSPTYKEFVKAATMATGLSERTIKRFLYETPTRMDV